MIKISLELAYSRLEACSAVWADGYLCVPSLDSLTGDADNEFLYIGTNDEHFGVKFKEGDNQEVLVQGCSMFLRDIDSEAEDDLIEITPLHKTYLE